MSWSGEFDFRSPEHIVFGIGTVERLGELAKGLGSRAPLVMTDRVLYELGATEAAEASLRDAGLRAEVFSEVETEPTLAAVDGAVKAFRSRGCDLIVALGGGSTIDSSKSVSLLLGNEGTSPTTSSAESAATGVRGAPSQSGAPTSWRYRRRRAPAAR